MIQNMYGNPDNFLAEASCEHEFWRISNNSIDANSLEFTELLKHAGTFSSSVYVYDELHTRLRLPVTSYTTEESFSTIQYFRISLRPAIGNGRLYTSCMMRAHKELLEKLNADFLEQMFRSFCFHGRRRRIS
jgi:hypothetical protein